MRPAARHATTLLRISTDAMFAHLCNHGTSDANPGIVRMLMKHKIVFRDRLRDTWVVQLGQLRVRANSFVHGFRMLRLHMGTTTHLPELEKLDLSIYDKRF